MTCTGRTTRLRSLPMPFRGTTAPFRAPRLDPTTWVRAVRRQSRPLP
jgi:hypothetical protein